MQTETLVCQCEKNQMRYELEKTADLKARNKVKLAYPCALWPEIATWFAIVDRDTVESLTHPFHSNSVDYSDENGTTRVLYACVKCIDTVRGMLPSQVEFLHYPEGITVGKNRVRKGVFCYTLNLGNAE